MLFCCLWRNVETSCHKHFVVVSRHQQAPLLTTSYKCHDLPRSGGTVLITPGCRSVDISRCSHVLAQNHDFCLPHLYSTPPLRRFPSEYCNDVWYKKTRMLWLYLAVKKIVKICSFVLTEFTNVTNIQTDRHTDTQHNGICRAYA